MKEIPSKKAEHRFMTNKGGALIGAIVLATIEMIMTLFDHRMSLRAQNF